MEREFVLECIENLVNLQNEKIEAQAAELSRLEAERDRLQRRVDDLEARAKHEKTQK